MSTKKRKTKDRLAKEPVSSTPPPPDAQPEADPAASLRSQAQAAAAAAAPAPKEKSPKKPSVKAQVAALLLSGESFTIDQLMGATKGTAVTVRTALTDLRNVKYAGRSGVLNVVNKDGRYSVAKEKGKS